METIVPLLDALSKDVEPVVKQHLVEQIKYLAKVKVFLEDSDFPFTSSTVLLPSRRGSWI